MTAAFAFTDSNIQSLFGHEAAEDEDPQRLREYYFKTSIYDQVNADVSLRILVGHKGIGKSALFKVAIAETLDAGGLPIVLQPNDITDLKIDNDDFLRVVRNWSDALSQIIIQKALLELGVSAEMAEEKGNSLIEIITTAANNAPTSRVKAGAEARILHFLDEPNVTVFLDDLDRGWQARAVDIRRISALLNAVRDIANANRSIRFKIALRSDVYYSVRTSDESTDKIEGSVIWQSWTNHEIFALLIKRIETFFGRDVDGSSLLASRQRELAHYLDSIMEARFQGKGHWANSPTYRVLMSLIRKRPRDLVKLCSLAARNANSRGSNRIVTTDLEGAFEEYSQGRVQDTINEYRSELPNIEALLINMKPNRQERQAKAGYVYRTADLLQKVHNIMQSNSFTFATGNPATAQELANFMYKINFLTARKETSDGILRRYFEENRYLSSQFADFGFDWEVHPAYRWALQPDNIWAIFDSLQLSSDDS
jgi:hypothetical protein